MNDSNIVEIQFLVWPERTTCPSDECETATPESDNPIVACPECDLVFTRVRTWEWVVAEYPWNDGDRYDLQVLVDVRDQENPDVVDWTGIVGSDDDPRTTFRFTALRPGRPGTPATFPIITVGAKSDVEAERKIEDQLTRNRSRRAYLQPWIDGGRTTKRSNPIASQILNELGY